MTKSCLQFWQFLVCDSVMLFLFDSNFRNTLFLAGPANMMFQIQFYMVLDHVDALLCTCIAYAKVVAGYDGLGAQHADN